MAAQEDSTDVGQHLTFERCLTLGPKSVVKREISEQEFRKNIHGRTIRPFRVRERLQNEAATLKFIASHTKIPVPQCKLYTKDGLLHLETERITNGKELDDIDENFRQAAIEAVEEQMNTTVLPQLRSLSRNVVGSVNGELPVFPPQRVYNWDSRSWDRMEANTDCYVLCHNDLGPQNIFVDPKTFDIVGIIDWEYSGFFPSYFELPLWRVRSPRERKAMYDAAASREFSFFGVKREDLKDCITQSD